MYDQIKKVLNKVISVKDNVYFIDVNELSNQYYKKIDNPTEYLKVINKKELIFKPKITKLSILPEELYEEILLKLPINDILNMQRTSKEWQRIIKNDSLWRRLYERDYKEKIKDNCYEKYILKSELSFFDIKLDMKYSIPTHACVTC